MIAYRIQHTTVYDYSEPVSLCQNVAHVLPRVCDHQHSGRTLLTITPDPAVIEDRIDYFGNPVSYFTIQEPHRKLMVQVGHQVTLFPRPLPTPAETPPWEQVRDRLRHDRSRKWLEAYQFVFDSRFAAAHSSLRDYAASSFPAGSPILTSALDLTQRIHSEFTYDPEATTLSTPVAEVFEKKRGVCQDFAHLQIACLRSIGLPARYVSGYLATTPPDGQPRLIGADATHAWISLFCGELDWVDLDPTNNRIPGDQHIQLAWGRDYEDVSPLKGVILGGGQHTVHVSVDVIQTELPPDSSPAPSIPTSER